MSNAMKYIRELEAAGVDRKQAEAQVQILLDAVEGDLATKADFALFKEQTKTDFALLKEQIKNQFVESELRLLTRLGIMIMSSSTITIALLTWIIKA